ncbi:hypothetical protein [Hymenobacter yonginensis]|uniref:Uncharacterized protein n=1 Tax=Hymenobacter yonginensis TaxID=748197 RepID=A0ABY7PTJ7_9BACT|nr:hypothetical protein [Hymenobacter yonginensis]WBO86245.1 hypothetical protein O9Z63_08280 [Hymenobacter yonginensis]
MERLDIWGRHFAPASTWNELTRAQLAGVVAVLYGPEQFWPAKLRLLSVVSGAPLELLIELPEVQVRQLYSLTDFLFSDEHPLTRQLLPELRVATPRPLTLAGPGDALSGVHFGEFIFADTYFCLYAKRQSAEAFDHFLAALYRPMRTDKGLRPGHPDWSGDARQRFNEHNVGYFARYMHQVPDVDRLSILLWYRGCRQQLVAEYPDVFDVATEAAAGSRQESADWGRVLRQLSGGAFGPLEQTAGQHVRTILAEMNDRAKVARHHKSTR